MVRSEPLQQIDHAGGWYSVANCRSWSTQEGGTYSGAKQHTEQTRATRSSPATTQEKSSKKRATPDCQRK